MEDSSAILKKVPAQLQPPALTAPTDVPHRPKVEKSARGGFSFFGGRKDKLEDTANEFVQPPKVSKLDKTVYIPDLPHERVNRAHPRPEDGADGI